MRRLARLIFLFLKELVQAAVVRVQYQALHQMEALAGPVEERGVNQEEVPARQEEAVEPVAPPVEEQHSLEVAARFPVEGVSPLEQGVEGFLPGQVVQVGPLARDLLGSEALVVHQPAVVQQELQAEVPVLAGEQLQVLHRRPGHRRPGSVPEQAEEEAEAVPACRQASEQRPPRTEAQTTRSSCSFCTLLLLHLTCERRAPQRTVAVPSTPATPDADRVSPLLPKAARS